MIVFRGKQLSPKKIKKILFQGKTVFELNKRLKLSAPVIQLEIDGEVQPDVPSVPEGMTPAILGVAILGRTILGVTSVLPKLSAPTIQLETVSGDTKILDAPVIRLETVSGEQPEEPVLPKLSAPSIRLEVIEDGGEEPDEPDIPVIQKLGTPVIRLEVIEDGGEEEAELILSISGDVITWNEVPGAGLYRLNGIERENGSEQNVDFTAAGSFDLSRVESTNDNYDIKDGEHTLRMTAYISGEELTVLATSNEVVWNKQEEEPVLPKLSAPSIRLEVIEDGGEEPDEPDIPVIQKLGTPVIRLEVIEDGGEEPDEPVITKLGTPDIYLEVIEEEEPIVSLDAPVLIYDEGDMVISRNNVEGAAEYKWYYKLFGEAEANSLGVKGNPLEIYLPQYFDDKPGGTYIIWCVAADAEITSERSNEITYIKESTVVPKLTAPSITLEVVEDQVPEEPDIPDIPVVEKLSAPVIELYVEPEEEPEPEEPISAPVLTLLPEDYLYNETNGTFDLVFEIEEVPEAEDYEITYLDSGGNIALQYNLNRGITNKTKVNIYSVFRLNNVPEGSYRVYARAFADGRFSEESNELSFVFSEEHDHKYTEIVTEPTCTKKGFTTHSCFCGFSYTDSYVDAKGHTEEIIPGSEPGCETTGYTDGKRCSVCGEVLVPRTVIQAAGHSFGEPYYSEEFSTGYGKKCSVCGALETLEAPIVTPKLEAPVIELYTEIVLDAPVLTYIEEDEVIARNYVSDATEYAWYYRTPQEEEGIGLGIKGDPLEIYLPKYFEEDGTYIIWCVAKNGDIRSGKSNEITYVKGTAVTPKLEKPVIEIVEESGNVPKLTLVGSVLYWTEVPGATYMVLADKSLGIGYSYIDIGGKDYCLFAVTENTMLNLLDEFSEESFGEIGFSVVAITEGNMSELSNTVYYYDE